MEAPEAFDYVVVGAGAAGCAAAARLSENPRRTVLLIEAGRDDPWLWLRVPLGIGIVMTGERALWRYSTEAEPGLGERPIFWPRGRVMGGTSTVNGMLWVRGDPAEYDAWAAAGCAGWDHASLLPLFRQMERTTLGDPAERGRKGPVNVVEYGPRDALTAAFVDACREAGIPANPDYNGAAYEGVGLLQLNTRRGLRHGAREAYLAPVRRRPNLTVVTEAKARRIDVHEGRAVSVTYEARESTVTAKARREIIVCAGAVDSPKLLQLSGIGDPNHLRSAGIAPIHALPGVGQGLRDHLHTRLSFRCTKPITLNDIMRSPLRKALFSARYLVRRDGLMAGSTSTAHAIVRSNSADAQPDLKLQLHPLSSSDARNPKKLTFDPFPGFGIGTFPLRPRSTGHVRVRSADPDAPPEIMANYLEDPEELAVAVRGVRMAQSVARQPALAPFLAEELRPTPDARSDNEIAAFVRQTGTTSYHPVGSCRMGTGSDAVVDPQLRVIGLEGLRVADASIFPTMPSSNTHVPSLLVGEMVARLLEA